MKRINITLFGIPLIGMEASSDAANGKTLKQAAKETAERVKSVVHEQASKLAEATGENQQ